jgi:hypothetical protein
MWLGFATLLRCQSLRYMTRKMSALRREAKSAASDQSNLTPQIVDVSQ